MSWVSRYKCTRSPFPTREHCIALLVKRALGLHFGTWQGGFTGSPNSLTLDYSTSKIIKNIFLLSLCKAAWVAWKTTILSFIAFEPCSYLCDMFSPGSAFSLEKISFSDIIKLNLIGWNGENGSDIKIRHPCGSFVIPGSLSWVPAFSSEKTAFLKTLKSVIWGIKYLWNHYDDFKHYAKHLSVG